MVNFISVYFATISKNSEEKQGEDLREQKVLLEGLAGGRRSRKRETGPLLWDTVVRRPLWGETLNLRWGPGDGKKQPDTSPVTMQGRGGSPGGGSGSRQRRGPRLETQAVQPLRGGSGSQEMPGG